MTIKIIVNGKRLPQATDISNSSFGLNLLSSFIFCNCLVQFAFFHAFCILCHYQMVDAILDVSVHKSSQIIYSIINSMVGDSSLWIIISADFRRTVASRNHCFTAFSYIINIFLMFFVINERAQTSQSPFLILRLIASLGTFYQDFFRLTGIRVLPPITQTNARFNLIDILSAGTATSECIPFYFSFINFYIKGLSFRKYGYRSCRSMNTTLSFCYRNTLNAVNTRFIFQCSIDLGSRHSEKNFFIAAGRPRVET